MRVKMKIKKLIMENCSRTDFAKGSEIVSVIVRKIVADKVQKLSADVCLYIHAVEWIKPNYFSMSVLAAILYGVSCWFLAFVSVGQFFVVFALLECTFVV